MSYINILRWVFSFLLCFQVAFASIDEFLFAPSSQMRRLVFVEDFYRLYTQNLYRSTTSIHTQIYYLKMALGAAEKNRWWIHPIRSFVFENGLPENNATTPIKIKPSEAYHEKYRQLMRMKVSLLLTQEYIQLAQRYDLNRIHWFHQENYPLVISKDKDTHYLKSTFAIAKKYYHKAKLYWDKTKTYVQTVVDGRYKVSEKEYIPYASMNIKSEFVASLEDEAYQIYFQNDAEYKRSLQYTNTLSYPKYNYDTLLQKRLADLTSKVNTLSQYIP